MTARDDYPIFAWWAAWTPDEGCVHGSPEAKEARKVLDELDRLRAIAAWVATLDLEEDEDGYGPERDQLLGQFGRIGEL